MFSSGKSSGVLRDPNFKNTVLLLHGDGTAGDTNRLITDSSLSPKTFSINPTTGTIRMGQGRFSPYLPNWSNYFNGNTSYISIPANSNYTIGTSNFTMEFWVNVVAFASLGLGSGLVVSHQSGGMFCINLTPAGSIQFIVNNNGGTSDTKVGPTSATLLSKNIWYHIACVRNGTELGIWINGVKDVNTITLDANTNIVSYLGGSGKPFYIGVGTDASPTSTASASGPFTGYISNFRYVLGTAVYTTNFTPPISTLTAITNTKILTCHKNRFIEELGSTVSVVNTPIVVVFNPFSPTVPYDSTYGSLSLPGLDNHFLRSDTASYNLGDGKNSDKSGDFTIEAWVYPYSGRQDWVVLSTVITTGSTFNTTDRAYLYYDGTNIAYAASENSTLNTGSQLTSAADRLSYAIPMTSISNPNTGTLASRWSHVALVRSHPGTVTLTAAQTTGFTLGSSTAVTTVLYSATVGIVNGSTALTLLNPATSTYLFNLAVGMKLNGAGIPADTFIISGSGTLWTMNAAATANGTSTVSISNAVATAEQATITITQNLLSTSTTTVFQPVAGATITLGAGWNPASTTARTATITSGVIGKSSDTVAGLGVITAGTGTVTPYMQITNNPSTLPAGTIATEYISTALTINTTLNSNSATVTVGTGYIPGLRITGTSIPANTYITAVSGTTITMSAAATLTTSLSASITGFRLVCPGGGFNAAIPTGILSWSNSSVTATSPAITNIATTYPILTMTTATSTTCTIVFRLTGTYTNTTRGSVSGVANYSLTKLYLNGTQVGTGNVANDGSGTTGPAYADSLNWSYAPNPLRVNIGKDPATPAGALTNGYITDARITRSAVYTTTFTPSTTPLSGSSSIMMLNFQNGKIYDSTGNNHLTTSSGTGTTPVFIISNVTSRFGGGAISFNGTAFAQLLNPDPIRIRNSDFTIEGWFYFNSTAAQNLFSFDTGTNGVAAINLMLTPGGYIGLNMSSTVAPSTPVYSVAVTSTATLLSSQWYHIAVVRSGINVNVYLNGTSIISATFSGSGYTTTGNTYTLGGYYSTITTLSSLMNGYIDEFRVSKIARYTGNFGPQFRIFPDN